MLLIKQCSDNAAFKLKQIEEKLRESETDVEGDEEDFEDVVKSTTPHMFCKTLTDSDTSTHGDILCPSSCCRGLLPSTHERFLLADF